MIGGKQKTACGGMWRPVRMPHPLLALLAAARRPPIGTRACLSHADCDGLRLRNGPGTENMPAR